MTHLARLPVYGHAFCPHCEAEFDLAQAAPTFGERFRKEVILYVMCPSCASHFNRRGPHTQNKMMMNKCFCNVTGLLIIDSDSLDKLGLSDMNSYATALEKLVGAADWVLSPSASSGITYKGETGPTRGIHAFLFIENAAFIPTTLETLHKRAVLLGYAWPLITKDGKILIRSLVDTAMKTSNQP